MTDSSTDIAIAPRHDAPTWEAVTEAVTCLRCGYDLRGLTTPRCPECGLQFEWADLFDPQRRRHPYLFEHHAQHHPVQSFVRTVLGSLRPGRFWRTITLRQPCDAGNLRRFCFLTLGIYLATALAMVAVSRAVFPPAVLVRGLSGRALALLGLAGAAPVLLQWLTVAALLIFQQSLSHWRVRSYHVVRCGAYAASGLLAGAVLVSGLVFALRLILFWSLVPAWVPLEAMAVIGVVGGIGMALLHWWASLWVAYRRYLKIRHPFAMLLSSQMIAALALVNILAWLIMR